MSRGTQDTASSPVPFRLQGCHLLWPTFPRRSPTARIGNSTHAVLQPPGSPFCPLILSLVRPWVGGSGPSFPRSHARDKCAKVENRGLGCSGFARRYYRNRGCFLFLRVLRWFTSPGSLAPAYVFSGPCPDFVGAGFPIRTSPDQSLLAAPRGLSQLATSFIACWRQGIHRTPLVA